MQTYRLIFEFSANYSVCVVYKMMINLDPGVTGVFPLISFIAVEHYRCSCLRDWFLTTDRKYICKSDENKFILWTTDHWQFSITYPLYMSPEKLKPQRQWWDQRQGFKDTFSYQKCCWSDLLFISYFEGSLGRKYVKITSVTNFGEDAPGVSTVWFFSRTNALVGGSQWGGGFYGYRLKFGLFYGYRLIFFSYG